MRLGCNLIGQWNGAMPSSSEKQHKFMEAVAHSPEFAKKADVPQSVGKDFAKADDKAGITKKKTRAQVLYPTHGEKK